MKRDVDRGSVRIRRSSIDELNRPATQMTVAGEVKKLGRDGEVHAGLSNVVEAAMPIESVD